MTRKLTDHITNPANDKLEILVVDEPAPDGANHLYAINWASVHHGKPVTAQVAIPFQNGPIPAFGVNGVTHEALLAIVIDRLKSFQAGPFACNENEMALEQLEGALHWLKTRTRARMGRGVEGTNKQ